MAGSSASLTFRLFGVDVTASKAIDKVGLAAASTTKSLEASGVQAAKWTAVLTGAGTAAVGAAGLIGVGLVGAIGGVGIAAAAAAPKVQNAFKSMTEDVKKSTVALSAPIQNVLVGLAGDFKKTFDGLKPTIGALFSSVAPVINTLGQSAAGAFSGLVKQLPELLNMAKPLVDVFARELGPTIDSFVAGLKAILGPASGASEAFGDFFKILQEVLPFVGELIGSFVKLGAAVLPVLVPVLQKLFNTLDDALGEALPDIGKALVTLLPALGTLFGALAQALLSLSPILPPLAKAFADIFTAIAPLIPQLVSHLTPIIIALVPPVAKLIQALVPLVPPILKILDALLPLLPVLAQMAVTIVSALLPALTPFINLVAQLAQKFSGQLQKALIDALPSLLDLAKSFGDLLTALMPLLPPLVDLLIAFTPLISVVATLASGIAKILVPVIRDVFVPVIEKMLKIWRGVVDGVVGAALWLSKHWSDVLGAVWRFTVRIWNDITGAITGAVGKVVRFFTQTIPTFFAKGADLARGLLSGAASILNGIGKWLGDHVAAPIGNFFSKTLGGAGAWLFQHGRNLINGLLNGAWDILKNIGKWVKEHVYDAIVNAIMRLFGIHSPSTVMAGLGGHMIEGLLSGLIFSARNIPTVVKKALGGVAGIAKELLLSKLGINAPLAAVDSVIKKYAHAQLALRGWADQWNAFNALVVGESGWNPRATNPTSGAYGIPQALPASKLDAYGNRNDPAVQINWMLDYIKATYGNPVNAYAKWLSRKPHWYDEGGWLQPGLTLAMNATGRPERVLGPRESVGGNTYNIIINGPVVGSRQAAAAYIRDGLRDVLRAEGKTVTAASL